MAAAEKAHDIVDASLGLAETAMDIIEETGKTLEGVKAWRCGLSRKQHVVQIVALMAVGGAVGGVVAYYIGKKKLEAKYEKISAQEIEEAKHFYKTLYKKEGFETPEEAADTLDTPKTVVSEVVGRAADSLLQYQGIQPAGSQEGNVTLEAETVNIFTDKTVEDTFDLEAEMRQRSPLHPYILHEEEFLRNNIGHQQRALTYYAGDDVLADEDDQPIPDVDKLVGEANLQQFGHGSGDANLLFVRNERLNVDFEIARSDGKYAHEVAGLQHSDDPRIQRMTPRSSRGGDE